MGNALGKVSQVLGEESWRRMPWRFYTPVAEQYKVLPTFAVIEWTYRVAAWACFAHAYKVGNLPLWFSGWICGTANDIWFMWLPLSDAFHQAQASVMLTPRLPLYIVEMYAVIIYLSSTGARQFNLPYLAEGCLTGLLAHVLYGVYDINGPPYLWWTWHDGDPSISKRQQNAPIGSSMWILTYIGLHQLLLRFCEYPACDANVTVLLRRLLAWALASGPAALDRAAPLARKAIELMERTQLWLNGMPWAVRIAWSGLMCTPMFMSLMGVFQALSLDTVGIPGQRTYRLTLLIYLAAVAEGFKRAHGTGALRLPKLMATEAANRPLFALAAAFYAVNLYLGYTGDSTKHVSTGCHQPYSDKSTIVYDIMRFPREEHLGPGAPREHSRHDFRVASEREHGQPDPAGRPLVHPKDDGSNRNIWFTVLGLPRQDKAGDMRLMQTFAVTGIAAYLAAFRNSCSLPGYIKG